MGQLYPNSIAETVPVSAVGMAVAFTIWFLVFVAAALVPILVAPILLVIYVVYQARQKTGRPLSSQPRAVRLGWSPFGFYSL